MRLQLTRRRVLIAAGGLAALLLLVLAIRPSPLEVEVAEAQVGPLQVVIEEDGQTRAVDRYVITAPVAGRLQRITLSEGQTVSGGEVVARIEPLPLDEPAREQLQAQVSAATARRAAAETEVARATAAVEQARREVERRRALLAEGAIAQEQVEQFALAFRLREQELEAAQEAVRAAAAEVEAVRARLLGTPGQAPVAGVAVRSPAAGTVLNIEEESERIVAAGEPLLAVGDPDALEVVVDVLTPDAVRIQPGMAAKITGWGGDTLKAAVQRVEPSAFTRVSALGVEEQRVNVILDLAHRPADLGDAFRVQVNIIVWSDDSVLTIPAAALFRGPEGWQTFVLEDGRAQLRDVAVGQRGDARTQILSGVEPGQEVVLFPPDDLESGTRVRPAGG
jgi:HlyD family secretion protein